MIIISRSTFNESPIKTVVVIGLTTNLRLAGRGGNFLVPARGSGLREDSVANVSQIYTVDKSYVQPKIGRLQDRLVPDLDAGVKMFLALD